MRPARARGGDPAEGECSVATDTSPLKAQKREQSGKGPEKIEVDVSALQITESMHVSDIKVPAGIKIKARQDATIAVVNVPEKEEEVVKPAAAAVPGAEGAVPAEGAAAAPGAPGAP